MLTRYAGRNTYSRQPRDRGYVKKETFKESKIGRGKKKSEEKNDLGVRMRGHNKVPDARWQRNSFEDGAANGMN